MRFHSYLEINELSYKGNIGIMELVKFHNKATPEQSKQLKELIAKGKQDEAWKLLQDVTGVKLHENLETPLKQISDKELTDVLGKGKIRSLQSNPFFQEYRNYERAYRYGVSSAGFPIVEIYFYFSQIHKTPEGKIRPEIMVRFEFVHSGWKIINAHKHIRAKEPDELEKKWGPSAGWRHVKSWKEVKE